MSSGVVLLILLGLIVVLVLFVIGIYNRLVGLRNQVDNSWSQIDVQLKRRHDLIPNLVETAKGYMTHERGTFEAITQARSQAMGAKSVADAAKAEGLLGQVLGKFMVTVESYPDLKANQNFLRLQEELTSTENKIGYSRQFYNDTVSQYNTAIQSFPTNLVANAFNFRGREFFEVEAAAERQPPQVKF